jgi:hypothetical protein
MQLAAQVKSAPYIEAKIDVVCASLQVLWGPQLPPLLVFHSALAEVASRSTRNTGVHHRWKPCWGSACCCCLCPAWYVMVLTCGMACHCFAAHPRSGVQAFSLGGLGFEAPNSPDAILEGTNAYTSFYVISWIAIGVGGVLGILALINEVRTFASHQCTPNASCGPNACSSSSVCTCVI